MPGSQGGSVVYAETEPQSRSGRAISLLLPWIEVASCGMLAGLLMWKGIIPGWRLLDTDFPNYYLVARLLREGYALDRIYDWVWLQRIKDHWGLDQPLVAFAGLTPFSALPMVPFSFFSALMAKRLWIVANLLFLGAIAELLSRVTVLGRRRVWILTLLAIFPLRTSFLLGQMHLLVLLLIVMGYLFRRKGKQVASALCLSTAGFLKVYPLLFVFYFLWKKQWRLAAAMLCAGLALLGISYAWIGSDAMNIYLTQVLPRSLQGEVLDPYSVRAASVAALFHRLFILEPGLNPAPLMPAPWLYALLYPLWQLFILLPLFALLQVSKTLADVEQVEWAAYLLALLVLSPVPASYHFVVMIFSVVLLVDHLLVRRKPGRACLVISLYFAISLIELLPFNKRSAGGLVPAFGRLWIELFLMGFFLVSLWQAHGGRRSQPTVTLRLYSLCSIGGILWAAGIIGYHHHFKYLQTTSPCCMPPAIPAYLSTGLRHTQAGYLVTVMAADRYRVLDQNGRPAWQDTPGSPRTDQLSAATAPSANSVVMELADRRGSYLVAIPSKDRSNAAGALQPFLVNGESPALSSGGTSVAFLREAKGHGTLWLDRLEQPLGRFRGEPIALTNQTYDVRDVSFAQSGWLLFTAKMEGHTRIFSLIPGGQPRVFLSAAEDVDSPAVSADERLVAFRKLLHGRWQLGYMDIASGHERMITSNDCNAYSPTWVAPATIAYATDCGRGLGLSALASIRVDPDGYASTRR